MKWLCTWFGWHRWEHVAGSVRQVIPGTIVWNRLCGRCGCEQDLSRMYGYTFLEAERWPAK